MPVRCHLVVSMLLVAVSSVSAAAEANVKLLFLQARTAFQTNEFIDVSVVRSATPVLAAGSLNLTVSGSDGSRFAFTFAVAGGGAKRTEHLHLNGWLLRPGHYTVEAAVDGATASAEIDVFSHLRRSDFTLINWGRAKGAEQLVQGEDSLGYNLQYMAYGPDETGNYIRAGCDYMANCVMSGGHQMDLRMECDWADPYVTRGGTMRVVRRAMIDRTRPNATGVHFYDEPGLTWWKDPETGVFGPHMIPAQTRSFAAAFGREALRYNRVDPKNPEHVAAWQHWARWKLGFMDAAWKESQFGVSRVRLDFLSVTQSQYGWSAFTDGYYFNVVRSLPVTSGHGGYHDYGPCVFNPSYFLEMSRARDQWKPCWYLPTWYGNTTSDQFRLEQALSFQTNIQGLMSPPDLEPAVNPTGRQGIVETNQLFQRLGPIFRNMPPTKPPVALLYSLSQALHTQTRDMQANYVHAMRHGERLPLAYLAGKLSQYQFLPILDEDVLDGTLANDHRAVVLTSLDYLDPAVVAKLEEFAASGGLVLLTADSNVAIKGGIKLGVTPAMPDQAKIDELYKAGKYNDAAPYTTLAKWYAGAMPLAKAIQAELLKAGIRPVFESSEPAIIASRQVAGDVEYDFAVNAAADNGPDKNGIREAVATIKLDGDRPTYDAIVGGIVDFRSAKVPPLAEREATIRFGPGQMRVFARTSRPIGGVRAATPVVSRELALDKQPIRVEVGATVLDHQHRVLSGSIPLEITVTDSLGVERHRLFRATKLGSLSLSLPLAANDPPGKWTVTIRELLANTADTVTFDYTTTRARSIAGATRRAVVFPDDIERCFQFARTHHDVTVVVGSSPYLAAAADRLAKVLEPWGVRCRRMELAEAAKSRTLTDEEAKTWVGLQYSGSGHIKPGAANPPVFAGFAVQGPVILLGNPDDNSLTKFLSTERFLPYAPSAELPGPGRGYVAWQRDGIGRGQESITLIASDEAGIQEAVGTFYEAVAGIESLTRWSWPDRDSAQPATKPVGRTASAHIVWTARLPDRVLSLRPTNSDVIAITHDGSSSTLDATGKVTATSTAADLADARKPVVPDATIAKLHARADRLTKLTAASDSRVAVAYWGGTLRVADAAGKVLTEQPLPQDVTALAWSQNRLLIGLADGRVLSCEIPAQ